MGTLRVILELGLTVGFICFYIWLCKWLINSVEWPMNIFAMIAWIAIGPWILIFFGSMFFVT